MTRFPVLELMLFFIITVIRLATYNKTQRTIELFNLKTVGEVIQENITVVLVSLCSLMIT